MKLTNDVSTKQEEKQHTVYRNAKGQVVPSVTTALNVINAPSLMYWANSIGRKGISYWHYMKSAARVGTLTHSLIERDVKGKVDDLQEHLNACDDKEKTKAFKAYSNFARWSQENEFELYGSEVQLVSNQYNYGGTVDFFGLVNGRLMVVDFKTSGSFQKKMFMQLAAYCHLLIENGLVDEIEAVMVLRLDKEKDEYYEMEMPKEELEDYFKLFRFALATHIVNEKVEKKWKDQESGA